MAHRFPSLEEFDDGQTAPVPEAPSGDGSSFLDRERALLGEDADQFATPQDRKATTVEDAEDDLLGGGGGYESQAGGETLDFENSFPEIDAANENVGPGGTITGVSSFPGSTYQSTYVAPEEEPDVIKEWRAKRDEEIEKRDKLSEERKMATVKEARQAIDDFYESYNDKKEKGIAQTRRDAEQFLASRDDTTAGGTSWERISKLVDLSAKGAKGVGPGAGKERFRELLVSLKKDEKAPGASGL